MIKKHLAGLTTGLFFCFMVGSGWAALIEKDLFLEGDGLLTLDTETNFEWLDITKTKGYEYYEIEGGEGGWTTTEGFRFATKDEVATLYSHAGLVEIWSEYVEINYAPAVALINLMGGATQTQTDGDMKWQKGFVSGPALYDRDRAVAALFTVGDGPEDTQTGGSLFGSYDDDSGYYGGSYLVRSPANATLIKIDDAIWGEGSIIRDTKTGLEWLVLTFSTGRSYNDVSSQFGEGGDFSGWRHATFAEIVGVFNSLNLTTGTTSSDNLAGAQSYLTLWGITWQSNGALFNRGWAIHSDGSLLLAGVDVYTDGTANAGFTGYGFPEDGYFDYAGSNIGSILVRNAPVSEPAPPIAAAGPDQSITVIGTTVELDGSESYDPEGDPITYNWTMVSKPADSNAVLSDPTLSTPTFQADIHGDYVIELIVSDFSSSSEPDQAVVSFENVVPVANAGTNHSVVQSETVCFDGSGSSDVNLDDLSYSWIITSMPDGSSATFDDPVAMSSCLTTDLAGTYEVSLTVNDGFLDSEPSTVNVLAIAYLDAITMTLQETVTAINNIDLGYFKNKNMQNTLTNKINVTLKLVVQGEYFGAYNKLQNDILGKTDGCASSGATDKDDWIQDCTSQEQVYPFAKEAIGYLENM